MTEDGHGRVAEQCDREVGQGYAGELAGRKRRDIDRLLPISARLAFDDARVEDRRDVADEIAIWICHPKRGSTNHAADADDLNDDAGLLGRLADRGLHRRFVRLDRSTDRLPQARFSLANHEQSTILIPREHGHRRKQHQVVANPLAQAAQVRGDAHSDASLQTINHRRSGPPNMLAPTVLSRRRLMLANSMFRMTYGLGALPAPGAMARFRLAADTGEDPQARLFVRGFGAHQIAVAALGLASRRWRTIERPAALAVMTIDVADMISAVVESDERERMDPDFNGRPRILSRWRSYRYRRSLHAARQLKQGERNSYGPTREGRPSARGIPRSAAAGGQPTRC